MECCDMWRGSSWDAGTQRHVENCEFFKSTAVVSLRQNRTQTTAYRKSIGEGSIYDSVEVRCSNGMVVNVYADGSVKQERPRLGISRLTGVLG